MNDTFTPEPDPDAEQVPVNDTDLLVDDETEGDGSESELAVEPVGDHPATDAVDPTSVTNPSGVADPTFATANQDDTSPDPVVVGAGGQHEASDPVALDAQGSESDEAGDDVDPTAASQSEGNKVHKDPEDPDVVLDGGGNPVHAPEVGAAALAEHRPGVRGRPAIDD